MEIEYDIFISFKNLDESGEPTKDREIAYRLYEFLKSKNLEVFFSEATLEELGADSWGDEIEDALRTSKVFIALGTKKEYFYSYWLQRERTTFLTLKRDDKSKAIYSYIASPMTTKDLPDDIKGFECFENSKPNEFERLYSFISKRLTRYFYRVNNEYIDENLANPYKGLSSFTYEDRENYYGREEEAKKIANILKNEKVKIFSIVGSSGMGKSSFIFAGVIPLIKNAYVDILVLKPKTTLFKSFIFSIYKEQLTKANYLNKEIENGGSITLVDIIQQYVNEKGINKVYFIIDQFEEFYQRYEKGILYNQKGILLFYNQLTDLINSSISICIIISVKLENISSYIPFENYIKNIDYNCYRKYFLETLLTDITLKDIIEKPALKFGIKFQDKLIDFILNDIEDIYLPLPALQFSLYNLWKYRKNNFISIKSIEKIGGNIKNSINYCADLVFYKNKDKQKSIKKIFLKLIDFDKTKIENMSKTLKIEDFNFNDRKIVIYLANKGFITINDNEVKIAHEILISEWKRLNEWVNEYRLYLESKEKVEDLNKKYKTLYFINQFFLIFFLFFISFSILLIILLYIFLDL